MAKANTVKWIERLIWVYIYGGLLSIVLSLFVARSDGASASIMQWVGGIFVVIGVTLIGVRSILKVEK